MRNNEEELHFQFVKAFVIVLISLWTRFVCVFLELSQITSNVYLKLRTNSITMRFNFFFIQKFALFPNFSSQICFISVQTPFQKQFSIHRFVANWFQRIFKTNLRFSERPSNPKANFRLSKISFIPISGVIYNHTGRNMVINIFPSIYPRGI